MYILTISIIRILNTRNEEQKQESYDCQVTIFSLQAMTHIQAKNNDQDK